MILWWFGKLKKDLSEKMEISHIIVKWISCRMWVIISSALACWQSCSFSHCSKRTTSEQSGHLVGLCLHFLRCEDRLSTLKISLQWRHSAALPNVQVTLVFIQKYTKLQIAQKETLTDFKEQVNYEPSIPRCLGQHQIKSNNSRTEMRLHVLRSGSVLLWWRSLSA